MFWQSNNNEKQLIELQAQNEQMRVQICALSDTIAETSKALLGLEFPGTSGKYTTYTGQIRGLRDKFHNIDPVGADICSAVIRLRSAFIRGNGIKVINNTDRPDNKTYKWFKEFMKYNALNTTLISNIIQGGEIEGKALVALKLDRKNNTIGLRYIPYHSFSYTVNVNPRDYAEITSVEYSALNEVVKLRPEEMVFIKLGGDVDNYQETYPRLGTMLDDFEGFSVALANWRKTNRTCATPTPHIDFDDSNTAREFAEKQNSSERGIRWELGKMLITANARFAMVNAGKDSQESLEKEILTRGKVISAGTGIPVHYIGLPELMSNRSTADNLKDLISTSIQFERSAYMEAVNELKTKAIDMANDKLGTALKESDISLEMPYVGQQELENIKDILLPIRNSSAISTKTFLRHVPFIEDPIKEMEQIEEEMGSIQPEEQNLPGVDTRNQDVSRVSQRQIPSGTARNGNG